MFNTDFLDQMEGFVEDLARAGTEPVTPHDKINYIPCYQAPNGEWVPDSATNSLEGKTTA